MLEINTELKTLSKKNCALEAKIADNLKELFGEMKNEIAIHNSE